MIKLISRISFYAENFRYPKIKGKSLDLFFKIVALCITIHKKLSFFANKLKNL